MGLCTDTRTTLNFLLPQKNLGENDVIEATKGNREAEVKRILTFDPSSRFQVDESGRTALHWATEYGYRRLAHTLLNVPTSSENLQLGQSLLNMCDFRGQTALHIACNCKREDLTSLYITLHSDLNLGDRTGNTALHRAVRNNLETTAIMMCEFGADVNAKNELQWTPLHEAARTGNENILRVLIQRGADLDAVTQNKMTPFLTAFFYYKIASKGNTYSNLESVWKIFIESGCSLSKSDGHWTPLTAAIACDNSFIASILLLNGCQVDRAGRWGRGILQDAFACSEPMLVKLLVLLGYIPSPDEVLYCSKQIPMYSKLFLRLPGLGSGLHRDRQAVVRWLKERQATPPSLSECCRVSVRQAMNVSTGDRSITPNISRLPLPGKLQRFLAMSDFTHYLLD
ncbi:putative ankyrin repeat protein RF_0381 [Physella acuta]|uniref:putative ankyrin repeat protein RF_0381 n=1 Tax=Physella acuta TaxID=109671 RepID=UPI0027DB2CB7|nr:putative ankyrin repeat protein RF_0381 [Physella acuta]